MKFLHGRDGTRIPPAARIALIVAAAREGGLDLRNALGRRPFWQSHVMVIPPRIAVMHTAPRFATRCVRGMGDMRRALPGVADGTIRRPRAAGMHPANARLGRRGSVHGAGDEQRCDDCDPARLFGHIVSRQLDARPWELTSVRTTFSFLIGIRWFNSTCEPDAVRIPTIERQSCGRGWHALRAPNLKCSLRRWNLARQKHGQAAARVGAALDLE